MSSYGTKNINCSLRHFELLADLWVSIYDWNTQGNFKRKNIWTGEKKHPIFQGFFISNQVALSRDK